MMKYLLLFAGILSSLTALARDFSYTYQGKSMTYTVINEEAKTCQTKSGSYYQAGNIAVGDAVIPSEVSDGENSYTVTRIGDYGFSNCPNLSSVVIPASVTSIGDGAFLGFGSSGDAKVEFASIEALCKIHFGVVYSNPLSGAHHLYINGEEVFELVIPEGVTSIGDYVFNGCSSITSVTIPESVTSIGSCSFMSCSSLKSVTIPENVTSIGNSAFSDCTSLTSVSIPESVLSIGSMAFMLCKNLSTVTIPKNITFIGNNAFLSCYNLTSVYYGARSPIKAQKDVFDSSIYGVATLFMTEEGIKNGSTIDPWKNFKDIEAFKLEGVDEVISDKDSTDSVEIYDFNGIKVADDFNTLAPGLYLIRQGKQTKKVFIK